MKYLDEYRDLCGGGQTGLGNRTDGHKALDDHGVFAAARRIPSSSTGIDELLPPANRTGARSRLPGMRYILGDDRPGSRHRRASRRNLLLVR